MPENTNPTGETSTVSTATPTSAAPDSSARVATPPGELDGGQAARLAAPGPAVLDSAHIGDIQGAFGSISLGDVGERRTAKQRLLTLAAIVGPGIIVMVGDNDAGGVATYAQAGQQYGTSLLWVLLLLIPVLVVNQEMVVRLGAVTGVGHARLINERFGRGWGWFSVGDLFLLNFLTLATEFIGVALAADYIGLSKYVVVPAAAVMLVAIAASGSFARWERAMFASSRSVWCWSRCCYCHTRTGAPSPMTSWSPGSAAGSPATRYCS